MPGDGFDEMRAAWRGQMEELFMMPVNELQARAMRLTAGVRRRNLAEFCAAAFVAAVNVYYFFYFSGVLARVGSALLLAGIAWIVLHLRWHGSVAAAVPMHALPSLDFLTRELTRQRDLLRDVWNWYLLPLLPGVTLFLLGLHQMKNAGGEPIISEHAMVGTAAACASGFALIAFANNLAAGRLQRQIDLFSSLRNGRGATE
jgi:hypothetical protein